MISTSTIVIRKFQPDDLPQLKQLVNLTIDAVYGPHYASEIIEYWKRLHTPQKIFKDVVNGHAVVMLDHNKIIGTGSLVGATIKRIFIHPNYHRQGLGRQIMNYLEQQAMDNGQIKVYLDAANISKAFYLQLGYQVDQEEIISFHDQVKVNYFKMSKSLLAASERLFHYHKKVFRPLSQSGQGLADSDVLYHFQQSNNRVWGTFKGGQISYGHLLGLCQKDGSIKLHFQYLTRYAALLSGSGLIKPTRLRRGHLKLGMNWKFFHPPQEEGILIMKELPLNGYLNGSVDLDAITNHHSVWSTNS